MNSPLNEKEERFFKMLKERKKENEPKDEILCTMVMILQHSDKGDSFYLDKAMEYAERHPEALLKDIISYLISLRSDESYVSEKEAV